MLRILIADAQPIVRRGLKHIVAETSDMVVAGEASNGDELLKKVRENDYDVVLLEISMPGKSGIDILKELKSLRPNLPVLILTIHPEVLYAVRMLRAGAAGYLTKDKAPEDLIEAIRKVSQGGKYISSSLAERFARDLEVVSGRPRYMKLSEREFEVMHMVSSGETTKEIAKELSVSAKTVSTYRSRILQKMRMKNVVELTRYAMRNNLVD